MRCAAALLLLVLLAPAAGGKGLEAQGQQALGYLAGHAADAGALASHFAEAAHANGEDPFSWPARTDPIAGRIEVPGEGASNVSLLRPLRALALAGDARAGPEGELTRRVLANGDAGGHGDPRTLNDDAYAVLALRAAGLPQGHAAVQAPRMHLLANQGSDGGWGWAVGAPPGTDMTGLALEALHASGGIPAEAADGARAFLASTRLGGRGWSETPQGTPNCESTVWGLRASDRLGEPAPPAEWRFLMSLQRADGGFAHVVGGPSDVLCTAEAATLLGEARSGLVHAPVADDAGIPGPGFAMALGALLVPTAFVAMSMRHRDG